MKPRVDEQEQQDRREPVDRRRKLRGGDAVPWVEEASANQRQHTTARINRYAARQMRV